MICSPAGLEHNKEYPLADIEKIGIGFGCILDSARGVTLKSHQIGGWTNFPLKEWVEGKWNKPVFMENDASTDGFAEAILGNGCRTSRLFYITMGSGFGGGWIINGKIDNRQGLGAAEIGHICVRGMITELEPIYSGRAIRKQACLAAVNTDSLMVKLAGSLDQINAKVVYQAAEQGGEIATSIRREKSHTLEGRSAIWPPSCTRNGCLLAVVCY